MSFTIFQHEKTLFQAIKTTSSKSRKIGIFPKGLIHGFNPKMAIFPTFFFKAVQTKKMSFRVFQNKITLVQAIKTTSSNSPRIIIFPKGLTHGFGRKMGIFKGFFFSQYKPGKCLLPYSGLTNAFLGYKSTSSNRGKIDIFSHGFGPKMAIYTTFFLANISRKNVFSVILKRKTRISRL